MKRITIVETITRKKQPSLDRYFNEIRTLNVLSSEEETLLLQKIRSGDGKALEHFIRCNLKFVVSISKKYQYYLNIGDLINEGNLGLIEAIKKYDETKGFKFITYAVWPIRQGMVRAINIQRTGVRIPQSQLTLSSKVSSTAQKLEQVLERSPTTVEILEYLKMDDEDALKVRDCTTCTRMHLSLDEVINDHDNSTLLNIIRNDGPDTDNNLMNESLTINIERILKFLPSIEREIIVRFYGLRNTEAANLQEIASLFNLTTERIRHRKDKALKRIRKRLGELDLFY